MFLVVYGKYIVSIFDYSFCNESFNIIFLLNMCIGVDFMTVL